MIKIGEIYYKAPAGNCLRFFFKDGNRTGDDYKYDTVGNLTKDLNKKIESITYNHLNLPVLINYSQLNGKKNGKMLKVPKLIKCLTIVVACITGYFIPSVNARNVGGKDTLLFSYAALQREVLQFKRISDPHFKTVRVKSIRPHSDIPNSLCILEEKNTLLKIKLYKYSINWFEEKGLIEHESIMICNKKHNLDSLFGVPVSGKPLRLDMTAMYEFQHGKRKYITVQFEKMDFNGTSPQPWYILLCDVTEKNETRIYPLITLNNDDGSFQAPLCIGDFNKDGNLDFAQWDRTVSENKIVSYLLRDGGCMKQPFFIELLEAEHCVYYIDGEKSKWYFSVR
ncbi:MAG: hypothetical protein J7623_26810 [Chitinophaga sp.]|uniref:hypothetical protein n=1 Tax=Chitinophaga sp. TaxID=1869181 RepID=UPI001B0BCA0B|nr:hypothetical protein [Chitinophaga sp.]MBO9732282.1 hypothetical protein [Chitinophaga sp.]